MYLFQAIRSSVRPHRAGLPASLATAALLLATATGVQAQFAPPPPGTQAHEPSALKSPPGARVDIIEFEEMECPDCAAQNPKLKQAAADYKIPWVRHAYPLPFHAWSMQAAVNGRWFDTKSKKLGDDYRDEVFANQPSIVVLDRKR